MSGTVFIDVLEGGDLDRMLSVDGSHDLALDANGVMDLAGFVAYPWGGDAWKNVDEKLRRAPSAILAEEFLAALDKAYVQNDLETNHDALVDWLLPDMSAAGTWTAGGTQLDGHVWCRRSWWLHHARQRYCIERAIQRPNHWGAVFTGSHSGSGTISGATVSGTASGTLSGGMSGSYTISVSGTLTSADPDGTLSGTISGALAGTFTAVIVDGVTTVTWTITSPAGIELTQTSSTFSIGGGGTTFTFGGSFSRNKTPDTVAGDYLDGGVWSSGGIAPLVDGIGRGKMSWQAGWRNLAWPWSPVLTGYNSTSRGYAAVFGWDRAGGDWPEPSSASVSLLAGNPGIQADHTSFGGGFESASARYHVFFGQVFTAAAGNTPINRPRSSMRNVYGFTEGDFIRYARSGYSEDGASVDLKLGFFWFDNTILAAPDNRALFRSKHFVNSVILGSITDTETNFPLDAILDVLWQHDTTSPISTTNRVPCFWIGPEWGSTIPSAPTDSFIGAGCTGGSCSDDASTAGCNHLIPWGGAVGSMGSPKIGTNKYPFSFGGNAANTPA